MFRQKKWVFMSKESSINLFYMDILIVYEDDIYHTYSNY